MTNDDAINILRPIAERRMTFRIGNKAMQAIPDDIDRALAKAIDALNRLAAYEDTGFTPEDIKVCKPYMAAEHEGRLIVLPCKVGDTVHRIAHVIGKKGGGQYSGEYVVTEYCVTQSYITDRGVVMFAHKQLPNGNITTSYEVFGGGDIGETIFLTREEAEAALGRADNAGT